jgi:hypothetical protein
LLNGPLVFDGRREKALDQTILISTSTYWSSRWAFYSTSDLRRREDTCVGAWARKMRASYDSRTSTWADLLTLESVYDVGMYHGSLLFSDINDGCV